MNSFPSIVKIICLITFANVYLQYLAEGQQQQQSTAGSSTPQQVNPRLDFDDLSIEEGQLNRTISGSRSGSRRDHYDSISESRRKAFGSRRGQEEDDVTMDNSDSNDEERENDDNDKKDDKTTDRKRNKSRPKIHGVRVTVDTSGDGEQDIVEKKNHKDTKENVEVTDLGASKKRVGIHTDITFEISADADIEKTNRTNSRKPDAEAEEDASVPVFRGRDRPRYDYHKSKKPPWTPSFSPEHRHSYDESSNEFDRSYPSYSQGSQRRPLYPEYYSGNVPVYKSSGGNYRSDISSIYRLRDNAGGKSVSGSGSGSASDGWSTYTPRYWTTERSYSSGGVRKQVGVGGGSMYGEMAGYGGSGPSYITSAYNPLQSKQQNIVSGYQSRNWKPCVCLGSGREYRQRRENRPSSVAVKSSSSLIEIVNGPYLTKSIASLPKNTI